MASTIIRLRLSSTYRTLMKLLNFDNIITHYWVYKLWKPTDFFSLNGLCREATLSQSRFSNQPSLRYKRLRWINVRALQSVYTVAYRSVNGWCVQTSAVDALHRRFVLMLCVCDKVTLFCKRTYINNKNQSTS